VSHVLLLLLLLLFLQGLFGTPLTVTTANMVAVCLAQLAGSPEPFVAGT
jgi:hypothetical protein